MLEYNEENGTIHRIEEIDQMESPRYIRFARFGEWSTPYSARLTDDIEQRRMGRMLNFQQRPSTISHERMGFDQYDSPAISFQRNTAKPRRYDLAISSFDNRSACCFIFLHTRRPMIVIVSQ